MWNFFSPFGCIYFGISKSAFYKFKMNNNDNNDDGASSPVRYEYLCVCGKCSEVFLVCCEHVDTENTQIEDVYTDDILKIISNLDQVLASITTNQALFEKTTLEQVKQYVDELEAHYVNDIKIELTDKNPSLNLNGNNSIQKIHKQIEKISEKVPTVIQALKLHTDKPNEKSKVMHKVPVNKKKYELLAKNLTFNLHDDINLKFPKVYEKMDCPSHTVDIEKHVKHQKLMSQSHVSHDRLESVPGIGRVYSKRLLDYIKTIVELVHAATSMEKHDFKALMKCYANMNSHYSELMYLSLLSHHRKYGCETK